MPVASSGCGEPDGEEATPTRIAWISKGKCNTFFDASRFGARLAAADLEQEGEGPVDLVLLEPDDCAEAAPTPSDVPEECSTAAAQMNAVQSAIDQRFAALAITVANPACVGPLLDEAVDAGMKVITFDSDAPDSKRHTYYGMDNGQAARFLVDTLAALVDRKGKVAVQTSMYKDADGVYQLSDSTTYRERMAGITEQLELYADIELVATVPCDGNDPADSACAQQIESVLGEHPDLAGLILARGKVLRERELDARAPQFTAGVGSGGLKAVAFDAPDDALNNIRAGYATAVIAQKQFGWGYDVVRIAYDMVRYHAEPPAFYDASWYVVCRHNLDAYEAKWESRDFRGELAPCEDFE